MWRVAAAAPLTPILSSWHYGEKFASRSETARNAETVAALQAIAAHVANIPGRKNLVWLTANLPFSGAAMARLLSPANIAVYPVDARGLLLVAAGSDCHLHRRRIKLVIAK